MVEKLQAAVKTPRYPWYILPRFCDLLHPTYLTMAGVGRHRCGGGAPLPRPDKFVEHLHAPASGSPPFQFWDPIQWHASGLLMARVLVQAHV